MGEGTTTITCTAADGSGVKATCEVTVGETTPTPQPSGTITYTVKGVSFKMVSVSGGTFKMGAQKTSSSSSNYDADAYDNEAPVHNVTLSDYQIGETEVTQALWVAVMGSNPSNWLGDNLPVETVSWNDCQEFITKLNAATGMTFRLPTEAEWEFAARGGTKSQGYKYSGSNTLGDVAWYTENSSSKTHAVGTKQANELGLYDMSGNVWEWCSDWYASTYDSSAQSNPTGPTTGSSRVRRGGSWYNNSGSCRVTYRNFNTPTISSYYNGLRLALSSTR
ncbi:MAG: formylglycine-generating enzyme family protein [Bacteroidaceae bacterium]|nr:formylglycine-generating enzyme family protein [Bacteroidaceae bacterium]